MSDQQQAAMMVADDAYAGSATFTRLAAVLRDIFGMEHFLPAHQGRACEHILAKVFVQPGYAVPMNYHFTVRPATLQCVRMGACRGLVMTASTAFQNSCW
jgi:tryptophanase